MDPADNQLQRLWGMHDNSPIIRTAIESLIRAIFSHKMEIYFVTSSGERIRFVDNPKLRLLDHYTRCFREVARTLCVTHVAPVCEARTIDGTAYPMCPDRGSYQIRTFGKVTGNPFDVFVLTTQLQPNNSSSVSSGTVACGYLQGGPSSWRLQNAYSANTYGEGSGFSFFGDASSIGRPQPDKWLDIWGNVWPRRKGTNVFSSPNVIALHVLTPPSATTGDFQTPLTSLLQWDDATQCLVSLMVECERKKAFQNVYLEMSYPPPAPAPPRGDTNYENPARNPVTGSTTYGRDDGAGAAGSSGGGGGGGGDDGYDPREEQGLGPSLLPVGMGGRFDPDYVEMDSDRAPILKKSQRRLNAEEIHEENMAAAIHLSKFAAKFYKQMQEVRAEFHQVSLGQLVKSKNLMQSLTLPEVPDYWPLPQLPGGKIVAVPTPEVRGDVLKVVQMNHELQAAAMGMPHALLIGASSSGSGGGTYTGVADNALRQSLETIESLGMRLQDLIAETFERLHMGPAREIERRERFQRFLEEKALRKKEASKRRRLEQSSPLTATSAEGGSGGLVADQFAPGPGGDLRIPYALGGGGGRNQSAAGGRNRGLWEAASVSSSRKRKRRQEEEESDESSSSEDEDSSDESDDDDDDDDTGRHRQRQSRRNPFATTAAASKELQFTSGKDYLTPPEEGHIECILPGLVQISQILELAKGNFLDWNQQTREMIGKLLGLDPSLLNQKDPMVLPGDLLKIQAEEIKAKATEAAAGYEVEKAEAEAKKAGSAVEKAKVDVQKAKIAMAASQSSSSASASR